MTISFVVPATGSPLAEKIDFDRAMSRAIGQLEGWLTVEDWSCGCESTWNSRRFAGSDYFCRGWMWGDPPCQRPGR